MRSAIIYGSIGGFLVSVAVLLRTDFNPIRAYIQLIDDFGKFSFIGLGIRIFVLMALGGFWVHLMRETDGFKGLQLGIAAPAAIAALLGLAENKSISETIVDPSGSRSLVIMDSLWAGINARPLTVKESDRLLTATDNNEQASYNSPAVDPVIDNLIFKFTGPERSEAGDTIAGIYNEVSSDQQDTIVEKLLQNLKNESPYSYRTNIHTLRTLGKLESWSCPSDDLCAAFENSQNLTTEAQYQKNYQNALSSRN